MFESLTLSLFVIYAHFTSFLPPRIILGICGLILTLVYQDFGLDGIIFKFVGKNIFRKPYFNNPIEKPISKGVSEVMYRLILCSQGLLMMTTSEMSGKQFLIYQKSIIITMLFLYPIVLLNIYASKEVYQQYVRTIDVIYKFYCPENIESPTGNPKDDNFKPNTHDPLMDRFDFSQNPNLYDQRVSEIPKEIVPRVIIKMD